MSQDQVIALTGSVMAIILVGASLMTRRLPARTIVRLGSIWAAIFLALFLIVKTFEPRIGFT